MKVLDPKDNYGAVISMDINFNYEYLIAGYENGYLIYWDVLSSKLVKLVTNVFKNPVL